MYAHGKAQVLVCSHNVIQNEKILVVSSEAQFVQFEDQNLHGNHDNDDDDNDDHNDDNNDDNDNHNDDGNDDCISFTGVPNNLII
uniref:Uncharacterized protein n=1 Tax=Glossina morsitans morsitans TaxID=37546 RepID=A0A1B0G1U9_GLOMM